MSVYNIVVDMAVSWRKLMYIHYILIKSTGNFCELIKYEILFNKMPSFNLYWLLSNDNSEFIWIRWNSKTNENLVEYTWMLQKDIEA